MAALVLGGILGTLNIGWLNDFFNFIASVYTRLFQFVAVPTIALAVTTTLALLGTRKTPAGSFCIRSSTRCSPPPPPPWWDSCCSR